MSTHSTVSDEISYREVFAYTLEISPEKIKRNGDQAVMDDLEYSLAEASLVALIVQGVYSEKDVANFVAKFDARYWFVNK